MVGMLDRLLILVALLGGCQLYGDPNCRLKYSHSIYTVPQHNVVLVIPIQLRIGFKPTEPATKDHLS